MQFGETSTTRDIFQYFTAGRMASVVLILALTAVFIRYATRLLDLLSRRGSRIRFLAKGAEPILRITLWFVAMLISFRLLAPTRETFLAAIGSAAIAIGLGAQDLIQESHWRAGCLGRPALPAGGFGPDRRRVRGNRPHRPAQHQAHHVRRYSSDGPERRRPEQAGIRFEFRRPSLPSGNIPLPAGGC